MRNYNFLLALLCLLFSINGLFAQNNSVEVAVPPAPGAASLGEHLEIPVGEYTGTLDYGIPLYDLKYREISVPISIGYHSAGVKVSEEASEVGIGWSLSAGGVITRAIRGQDDFGGYGGCNYDRIKGYYKEVVTGNKNLGYPKMGNSGGWDYTDRGNLFYQPYTSTHDVFLGNYPDQLVTIKDGVDHPIEPDYLCMNARPNDLIDWESDLYSFHLGGYSGKFIITQNGEIKTIESSELEIDVHNANTTAAYISPETIWWSVKTPDGLSYVFGADPNSKQWTYENTIEETWPESLYNQCKNEKKYISSWYLNKIITPRGKEVVFSYDREEHDVVPVPKYQEFYENITNFDYTSTGCGQPISYNELGYPDGYKFTRTATLTKYDDVKLTSISTPFNDEISFYYGARSDIEGGEKLERIEIQKNNTLIRNWVFGYDYFSARGGGASGTWFNHTIFQQFKRGANDEKLAFISDELDISDPMDFDNTYEFKADLVGKRLKLTSLTETGTGGAALPPYVFTYNGNLLPRKHSFNVDAWGYSNNQLNTSLVPEWTVELANGNSVQIPGANRTADPDGDGVGSLSSVTVPTGGRREFTYEPNQYVIFGGTTVIGGGYRVKAVKSYNNTGGQADYKEYLYADENEMSSGKAFNNPNLAERGEYGSAIRRDCPYPNVWTYTMHTLRRNSASISALSSYYRSSYVGYSTVTKLDGLGGAIGSVKSTFYNDFFPRVELPFMGTRFPNDYSLMNGKIVLQEIYSNKNKLVQKTFYDYIRDFDGGTQDLQDRQWNYVVHYPPGTRTTVNPNGLTDDVLCDLLPNTGNNFGDYGVPHLYTYSDKFYRILPKSITTTTFDEENNSLFSSVTQSYKYLDGRTLLRSNTISGPGGSKVETYYYPEEMGAGYQFMVDADMKGVPVKVISSNGSTYETKYHTQHFVPERFTEIFSDNSEVETVVTDFYLDGFPQFVKSYQYDFPIKYTWQQNKLIEKKYNDQVETWTYNTDRTMSSRTAIDGQVVTFLYDGLQRLDKTNARSNGIITDYDYVIGGLNEVTSTITYMGDGGNTAISRNTFDGFGRPLNSYSNGELKQGRKYDRYGRVSQQTFNPGRWMRLSYDGSPLRRVRSERYPDGNRVRYRYLVQNGFGGVERDDEKRNKTITLTDVFGRTAAVIDPQGGETSYNYTAWDAPATIQPPQGLPFVYTYYSTRKLESKTIPGGGTTTYSYDDHHWLSATMTPRGEVVGNVYDPYGRIKSTHFGGSLPGLGEDYNASNAEYMLRSMNYFPDNGDQAGRLDDMTTRMLNDDGGLLTTDYTYDDYGRLMKQVEGITLDDDTYTLTTNVNGYTHRDLPANNSFHVERNGQSYELTSTMSYDVFGRAEKEDYNFKVNGATQLEEPNWHAEFTYNTFDQMTNKRFWKKPRGGWYGEKYSYNGRGWLTQINSPSSRSFDVEYCEQPDGNVYQGSSEEAEVTFEQLLQLMLDGEAITLVDFNNCPDDDGGQVPDIPDVPHQGDCIKSVSDYYTNFDPGNNLYTSKSLKEKGEDQDADDYRMIALVITGGKYYDGGVKKEFTFSKPIEFASKSAVFWDADVETMKERADQLNQEISMLFQKQNVLQPEISVSYEDGIIDVHINKSSFNFSELSISEVWKGIDGNLNTQGGNVVVSTVRTLDSGNTRNIRCQNLWSTGNDIKDNWTFPVKLFEVFSETKKNGGKQFVTEAGLAAVSGNYDIGKQYYIPSDDQVFKVTLKSGAKDVISYPELRESLKAGLITDLDMPKDVKGNTLVTPTGVEPCLTGFSNPSCSASEQEAQLNAVQQMLTDIDPQTLSYPVSMSYITLCNGQNVLLLGTESELENQLPGDFHFLDQVEVTSANQLFNIRISVPDAIFSATMDHEKNGNIADLTWKTTFHKSRGYEFSYDPLNRLSSAEYTASGYTGEGFTADNFTYDGIGNILSLRRYAQLIPGEDAVLIDDLRYKYHDGLQPGETFPLGNDQDVSRLLSVLELGTTEDALQNGFKPGEASANDAYGYDGAGNMSSDPYKGFGAVYNHLNLPKEIGGDKVTYSASGKKWRVEKEDGKIYHYIGPMTFVDDEFEAANLTDGRIYNAEVGSQNIDLVAEYYSKDHLGNVRATFTDRNGDGLVQLLATPSGPAEINQTIDYYPFGLQYSGQECRPITEPENRFQYNGKEFVKEVGLNDYGARWYNPTIGRWTSVDPQANLQGSISPYAYSLNNPIVYIDPDGSLPILINGLASGADRGGESYWTENLLNTIATSGIPNPGGQQYFIDGNRGFGKMDVGMGRKVGKERVSTSNAGAAFSRTRAGRAVADQEFEQILSMLERDPETGLITENIQIYSHSRGGAFAAGFTGRLRQLIEQNKDQFADPNNVIDFGLHLAPHQSNAITASGDDNYSISHLFDGLSGNDMGNSTNFHTNSGEARMGHGIESFTTEVDLFLQSWQESNGVNAQIIEDFMRRVQAAGISITVR